MTTQKMTSHEELESCTDLGDGTYLSVTLSAESPDTQLSDLVLLTQQLLVLHAKRAVTGMVADTITAAMLQPEVPACSTRHALREKEQFDGPTRYLLTLAVNVALPETLDDLDAELDRILESVLGNGFPTDEHQPATPASEEPTPMARRPFGSRWQPGDPVSSRPPGNGS